MTATPPHRPRPQQAAVDAVLTVLKSMGLTWKTSPPRVAAGRADLRRLRPGRVRRGHAWRTWADPVVPVPCGAGMRSDSNCGHQIRDRACTPHRRKGGVLDRRAR